jgi:SAM-dependent methyltransferase
MKGFDVVSVDLSPPDRLYDLPSCSFVQGDIRKVDLGMASFDVVINCSTVEHVGLAGRYGVSEQSDDGDFEAMTSLRRMMKPGGLMLLVVPVGQDDVFAPLCRVYGRVRLPRLLRGFEVVVEDYWAKDSKNRWVQTSRDGAMSLIAHAGAWVVEQNFYGIGCFELRVP